jgi:serine/threonine protein phosphatase PrpC
LLLCSDGLHGVVGPDAIRRLLEDEDVERVARRLVEEALAQGSRDNISVVVVSYGGKG